VDIHRFPIEGPASTGISNENGVNADWVEQHSQRAVFGDDSLRAQATSERRIPSRRPVARHHERTRQRF